MIINSRNDKSMPMNSEFTFDVSRIIKPKKLVVPYYTLGTENVAWVHGYSLRDGDRSKQPTHLYLMAGDESGSANRAYSTVLADLTNIKTLFVDWENTGLNSTQNVSLLQVSTSATATHTSSVAQLALSRNYARQPGELDVSAISGEYHVIVMARDNNGSIFITSEIKVYRVWGEG